MTTLGAEWNFADFILATLWFFLVFIWIWLLITVFADVFRRHDISGWIKTLWILFVIVLPYLGVFIYLITQGHSMARRNVQAVEQQREELRQVVGYSAADELEKLSKLHDSGQLSDAEYQQLRAKVLAG
jgi:Short C-terminal domain/Phospholipase_D-nuclease N-terminal